MPNVLPIFLTGLLTGGLTCLAVQGGLLATVLAQRPNDRQGPLPILAFLGTKLVVYTLLGVLLGQLGSVFQLSISTQIFLQIFVAIFMVGTALNLLNAHPVFRYFVLQPPRFLTRLVHGQAKSSRLFAPATIGAFTAFIPCGTTQAMMALAIASGNPLAGALIMFFFILGTSPVFFILGYFMTRLEESLHRKFLKIAATAIIFLALFNLNNAIVLTGTSLTPGNIVKNIWCTVTWCPTTTATFTPTTNPTINFETTGYTPGVITVRAGSMVSLNLVNKNGAGCIQAFRIPALGIQKTVPVGTTTIVNFLAPARPGQIPFMCSMGMFRGIINVV